MHPIKNPKIVHINATRICVPVKRKGKSLIRDGTLSFARPDTVWAELPKHFKVINDNGEEVPAAGKFLITVESIDPYHLITDYTATQ